MKLEHFQYVVAIAECHSLSKAARDLYITQPTLSVNLHQLETELGFSLFDRSYKGMELTDKGREFYQIAKRVMEEMNRVHRLTLPPDEPREIILAAVPVFCNAAMLDLLAGLRSASSDTVLNIMEASRTEVSHALFNREASLPGLMALDNLYVETGLVSVVPLTDGVIKTMLYLGYSSAEPLTKREEIVVRQLRLLSRSIERDLTKLLTAKAAPSAQRPSIYY